MEYTKQHIFDMIRNLWSRLGVSELIALKDELDKEIEWADEEAEVLGIHN